MCVDIVRGRRGGSGWSTRLVDGVLPLGDAPLSHASRRVSVRARGVAEPGEAMADGWFGNRGQDVVEGKGDGWMDTGFGS